MAEEKRNEIEETKNNIPKEFVEFVEQLKPVGSEKENFVKRCNNPEAMIRTGILSIDKMLNGGLTNELYIMAAETSTGKSAFFMFIAQAMARNGVNVLYVSLEMGKTELIARGVSSLSYDLYKKLPFMNVKPVETSQILFNKYDEELKEFTHVPYKTYEEDVKAYFQEYGEHLYIIEGGIDGLSAKDIEKIATMFKQKTQKPVVVFVDYLQILKPDPESATADRKSRIDSSVLTLKVLASQIGIPVLTMSSVSRNEYGQTIRTRAFKESGDTEYTAGILLGWNWEGVTNAKNEEMAKKEKERCRKNHFRIMSLEVLKNRNGARNESVYLVYRPEYSYFEEDAKSVDQILKEIQLQQEPSKKPVKRR